MTTAVRIAVPERHALIDANSLARCWVNAYNGTAQRMACRASAWTEITAALNRILGRMPRVWFSQQQFTVSGSTHTAENSGSDPLYRWRAWDGVPNARSFTVDMATVPREERLGNASWAGRESGSPLEKTSNISRNAVMDLCNNVFRQTITCWRNAASMVEATEGLSTYGGMTVLDAVVQDDVLPSLETNVHDWVNPSAVKSGDQITANIAEECREKLHSIRTHNLPVLFQWSGYGESNAWQKPAATDETAIVITNTINVNLLDHSIVSVNVDTPGAACDVQYCGRGDLRTENGSRVRVDCGVYASCDSNGTGYGTASFVAPGWAVTVNVPCNTATPDWFGWEGNCVYLNSAVPDDCTNNDRNKIDVLGSVTAAGTNMYIHHLGGHHRYE
jgi:hypothetical protein